MSLDWRWPQSLDALTAAPANHRLLFENDSVRVLDTRIAPGERTAVHTHRWPAAHYVVSWSDFVRRDEQGQVLVDSLAIGMTLESGRSFWGEPLPPHSLENVGTAVLHIISTELKPPVPKTG